MAARRGRTQAKRNSSSHATPAWVWLVLGLLIGAGAFFIFKNDGGNFNPLRPQPNPDARPAQVSEADVEAVVPENTAPAADKPAPAKETQYDFYTLLPGKEVQLSDAELAASAREEEARRARAALNGTPLDPPAIAQPTPIAETPAAPAERPATATASTAAAATASTPAAATTVASAGNGARYILQAGAFGASGDAEATKAKIAMLGLSARVEAAQINDKTVYRVRMGPYGTASELADAKQKLASSGLPAMAIKAQ